MILVNTFNYFGGNYPVVRAVINSVYAVSTYRDTDIISFSKKIHNPNYDPARLFDNEFMWNEFKSMRKHKRKRK